MVDEVLDKALSAPLTPIEWNDDTEIDSTIASGGSEDDDRNELVTH